MQEMDGDHQFRMSRRDAFENETVPIHRRQRRRYGRSGQGIPYVQNARRYTRKAGGQRSYEPKQELSTMIKSFGVAGPSTLTRNDEEEIERRIAEIRKRVEKYEADNSRTAGTSIQAENSGQVGNSGQADNSGQAENAGQSGISGQVENSGKAGTSGQAGNSEQAGTTGQAGNSEQAGDSEQAENSEQAGTTGQAGNSEHAGNSGQAGTSRPAQNSGEGGIYVRPRRKLIQRMEVDDDCVIRTESVGGDGVKGLSRKRRPRVNESALAETSSEGATNDIKLLKVRKISIADKDSTPGSSGIVVETHKNNLQAVSAKSPEEASARLPIQASEKQDEGTQAKKPEDVITKKHEEAPTEQSDNTVPKQPDGMVLEQSDETTLKQPYESEETLSNPVPKQLDDTIIEQQDDTVPRQQDDTVPRQPDETVPKQADDPVLKQLDETTPKQSDETSLIQPCNTVPKTPDETIVKQLDETIPKQLDEAPPMHPNEAQTPNAEKTKEAKTEVEGKPTSVNKYKKLRTSNSNTTNNSTPSTSAQTGEDYNWFKNYYKSDESCERPNWRSHSIFTSARDSEQRRSNSKDKMEVLVKGMRRFHFDGATDDNNGPAKKRQKTVKGKHSLTTKKDCNTEGSSDYIGKTNCSAAVNLKSKDGAKKKDGKQKTKDMSKSKTTERLTKKYLRPHGKLVPGATRYFSITSTSVDELPIAKLSISVNKPKPKQLSRLLPTPDVVAKQDVPTKPALKQIPKVSESGPAVQTKPVLKQIQRISSIESDKSSKGRNDIAFLIYRFQKLKI